MSLEQAVQQLLAAEAQTTQQIEALVQAVNTRKVQLDTAVADAQTAATASLYGGVTTTVAGGNITLGATDQFYQFISPNGANRDVNLPVLQPVDAGRAFSIKNTGTAGNFLTVKFGGNRVGPTIGNGYSMFVVWSGTTWEVL